jgi:hypothetical protein
MESSLTRGCDITPYSYRCRRRLFFVLLQCILTLMAWALEVIPLVCIMFGCFIGYVAICGAMSSPSYAWLRENWLVRGFCRKALRCSGYSDGGSVRSMAERFSAFKGVPVDPLGCQRLRFLVSFLFSLYEEPRPSNWCLFNTTMVGIYLPS